MQTDQVSPLHGGKKKRGVQVYCTLYPDADADILAAYEAARGAGPSEKLRTLLRELIVLRETSAK